MKADTRQLRDDRCTKRTQMKDLSRDRELESPTNLAGKGGENAMSCTMQIRDIVTSSQIHTLPFLAAMFILQPYHHPKRDPIHRKLATRCTLRSYLRYNKINIQRHAFNVARLFIELCNRDSAQRPLKRSETDEIPSTFRSCEEYNQPDRDHRVTEADSGAYSSAGVSRS